MKQITPENMYNLSLEIADFLKSKELWDGIHIYVANKCIKSEKDMFDRNDYIEKVSPNGTKYFEKDDVDVTEKIEYCNKDTITITFEGSLYSVINYNDFDFIDKMNRKFLDDYGLYFEQGHAWSMAAYKA